MVLPVHNRFDHTNLNELKIEWKYENKTGSVELDIEPHQKGELVIPAQNWETGSSVNICFYKNNIDLVDEYNIRLGEKIIEKPVCENGKLKVDEHGNVVEFSGKGFVFSLDKSTGLIQDVKKNGELLIKSGPFINLRIPGKSKQYSTIEMDDYAQSWKCKNVDYSVSNGIAEITVIGKYDKIDASFIIRVDENGTMNVQYKIDNAPEGKHIQEAGIKFITGYFDQLSWDRKSYFTAYPDNHLGSLNGEISLSEKPAMNYRQQPQHAWELESKNFYYHGLEKELPYTNIVRSTKENVYTYALSTDSENKIVVFGDGKQACRFDKINGENILIINDQWDYTSLLWGNYMKLIKCGKTLEGNVTLKLEGE